MAAGSLEESKVGYILKTKHILHTQTKIVIKLNFGLHTKNR